MTTMTIFTAMPQQRIDNLREILIVGIFVDGGRFRCCILHEPRATPGQKNQRKL